MGARIPSPAVVLLLVSPTLSFCQDEESQRRFTAGAGAGFTSAAGEQAGKLDRGLNVQAGGGYFLNSHLGFTGNFLFSTLGVTEAGLTRTNQVSGSANVIGITFDPTIRFRMGSGLWTYALAGGGYLRRSVELTHNSIAQTFTIGGTPVILDPGFRFFGPPATSSTISVRTTDGGGAFDAGAGVAVPLPGTRLRIFVEGRFVRGFTGSSSTTIVPVTLGIRW